jgi:hypothetical protein
MRITLFAVLYFASSCYATEVTTGVFSDISISNPSNTKYNQRKELLFLTNEKINQTKTLTIYQNLTGPSFRPICCITITTTDLIEKNLILSRNKYDSELKETLDKIQGYSYVYSAKYTEEGNKIQKLIKGNIGPTSTLPAIENKDLSDKIVTMPLKIGNDFINIKTSNSPDSDYYIFYINNNKRGKYKVPFFGN